ncbi:MAG: 30S ribosomal protein S6 [Candidatus Lambdaproteobacteria bacterium]|nr:30S ribosomal protein S6 [Candidatus Lambdaproteobacteria bacterium]
MQGYESIFILDPNASEEAQKTVLQKFRDTVGAKGGKVVHETSWGRRKLAYPVKKRDYGIYHLFYLDRSPDALQALETQYRYDESVLKWLTVAIDDLEAEQQKFERLRTEGAVYKLKSE